MNRVNDFTHIALPGAPPGLFKVHLAAFKLLRNAGSLRVAGDAIYLDFSGTDIGFGEPTLEASTLYQKY